LQDRRARCRCPSHHESGARRGWGGIAYLFLVLTSILVSVILGTALGARNVGGYAGFMPRGML
jgi:hypothetical protein